MALKKIAALPTSPDVVFGPKTLVILSMRKSVNTLGILTSQMQFSVKNECKTQDYLSA